MIPEIKFKTFFFLSSETFVPLKVGKEKDGGSEGVVDLVTEEGGKDIRIILLT